MGVRVLLQSNYNPSLVRLQACVSFTETGHDSNTSSFSDSLRLNHVVSLHWDQTGLKNLIGTTLLKTKMRVTHHSILMDHLQGHEYVA